MARTPELLEIAKRFDLKIISIKDLVEYRLKHEKQIERVVEVNMPTKYGDFKLTAYKDIQTGEEHFALTKGTLEKDEPVLVRVHSSSSSDWAYIG